METKTRAEQQTSTPVNWTPEQRAARMCFFFDDGSFFEQRVVEQALDPKDPAKGTFFLYYFIKDETYDAEDKPTILFAAGGPGQVILPDMENFADMYGYRVVYFHIRGSGFSQVPNTADTHLNTANVVADVERIRLDLDISHWSAVIGHSYGAIVAHEYARVYPKCVAKVVLSAPTVPKDLFDDWKGPGKPLVQELVHNSLRNILLRKDFAFLDKPSVRTVIGENDVRDYLLREVRAIESNIKNKVSNSVKEVFLNYDRFKQTLKNHGLDYGVAFYGALRRLRHVGWLPIDTPTAKPLRSPKVDDTQLHCGLVIANAILGKDHALVLDNILEKPILKDKLSDAHKLLSRQVTLNTDRTHQVILENDNGQFLPKQKKTTPRRNKRLWEQSIPTLVLKGGADPVTENGQAEYYMQKALADDRVLVEFPGVGHSLALPELPLAERNILTIRVRIKESEQGTVDKVLTTRDRLIREFLDNNDICAFKESDIVKKLDAEFQKCIAAQEGVLGTIADQFIVKPEPCP